MYEEDRQAALAMYVKMFDDAEDEQALIQALISPTRQAVIVARAYNAKERKLQVEAQTREETGEKLETEGTPDFMLAIYQVYEASVPASGVHNAPMKDQFSLFEDAPLPEEETAAAEEALDVAAEAALDAAEAEPVEQTDALSDEDEASEAEAFPHREEAGQEETPVAAVIPPVISPPQDAPAETPAEPPVEASAEETPLPAAVVEPVVEAAAETPAPAAEETPSEDAQVEQFLAGFSIPVQELAPMPTAETAPAGFFSAEPAQFVSRPVPETESFSGYAPILNPSLAFETAPAGTTILGAVQEVQVAVPAAETAEEPPVETVTESGTGEDLAAGEQPGGRQLKPLVLILFLLVAVPVTLLGIAVLLLPTLFFLALGILVLAGGVAVLVSAFSGFPVFADIMLLLGAALIIMALGLLCLWTFVWFVGGGIVGMIRSVVSLGSRWCFKEVSQ